MTNSACRTTTTNQLAVGFTMDINQMSFWLHWLALICVKSLYLQEQIHQEAKIHNGYATHWLCSTAAPNFMFPSQRLNSFLTFSYWCERHVIQESKTFFKYQISYERKKHNGRHLHNSKLSSRTQHDDSVKNEFLKRAIKSNVPFWRFWAKVKQHSHLHSVAMNKIEPVAFRIISTQELLKMRSWDCLGLTQG